MGRDEAHSSSLMLGLAGHGTQIRAEAAGVGALALQDSYRLLPWPEIAWPEPTQACVRFNRVAIAAALCALF